MQSTSINLSTLKAYSMKPFPFLFDSLDSIRPEVGQTWQLVERFGDEWNGWQSGCFYRNAFGCLKIHDPNYKQNVLTMVNSRGNQRILDDFLGKIPKLLACKFGKGGTSRGSSGTIPCPSGRRLRQLDCSPATVTLPRGTQPIHLHFLPLNWGGGKTPFQTIKSILAPEKFPPKRFEENWKFQWVVVDLPMFFRDLNNRKTQLDSQITNKTWAPKRNFSTENDSVRLGASKKCGSCVPWRQENRIGRKCWVCFL